MSEIEKPPSLMQVIGSVLAAFFGVQNAKTHERDFTHGKPAVFILVGVASAILLVLLLFFIVKLVLALSLPTGAVP